MTKNNVEHTLPIWTEVEYSAANRNPYLVEPVFLPKETKYYLCREDGSREPMKLIFVVFKQADASEDDEWEDDPMIGEILVNALGDDDEEIEPAKVINLGMSPEDFITVVREDDTHIVFDIDWEYGKVKVDKAEQTSEGYVIRKDDFGEDGLRCTLTPIKGQPFTVHLQIPYIGFSLYDANNEKVIGEINIPHDKAAEYTYQFVGDGNNDRFSISLDNDRLNYLCVLRADGKMAMRDMRDRLSIVKQIRSEGKLSDLLMGAHCALVKNKSNRWRITLGGSAFDAEAATLVCDPIELARFAYSQYAKTEGADEDELAGQLILLEPKLNFQWFWLDESDWSRRNIKGADKDIYTSFDSFMKRLSAFSYISQKPIQGDQLQARNNKRKIARCARNIQEHKAGITSIWTLPEEYRKEILDLFGTFHREFVAKLEGDE